MLYKLRTASDWVLVMDSAGKDLNKIFNIFNVFSRFFYNICYIFFFNKFFFKFLDPGLE